MLKPKKKGTKLMGRICKLRAGMRQRPSEASENKSFRSRERKVSEMLRNLHSFALELLINSSSISFFIVLLSVCCWLNFRSFALMEKYFPNKKKIDRKRDFPCSGKFL